MTADRLAATRRRAGAVTLLVLIALVVLAPGTAAAAGANGKGRADVERVDGPHGKPAKAAQAPPSTKVKDAGKADRRTPKATATAQPKDAKKAEPKPTAKPPKPPKPPKATATAEPEDAKKAEPKPTAKPPKPPKAPKATATAQPKDAKKAQPVTGDSTEQGAEGGGKGSDRASGRKKDSAGGESAAARPRDPIVEPAEEPEPLSPTPDEGDETDVADEDVEGAEVDQQPPEVDDEGTAAAAEPDEDRVLGASLTRAEASTSRPPPSAPVQPEAAPVPTASAPLRPAPATAGGGEPVHADIVSRPVLDGLPPPLRAGAAAVADTIADAGKILGETAPEERAVTATTFVIAALVSTYLFVQGHIDRRDPKLAHAPYDDDLTFE